MLMLFAEEVTLLLFITKYDAKHMLLRERGGGGERAGERGGGEKEGERVRIKA